MNGGTYTWNAPIWAPRRLYKAGCATDDTAYRFAAQYMPLNSIMYIMKIQDWTGNLLFFRRLPVCLSVCLSLPRHYLKRKEHEQYLYSEKSAFRERKTAANVTRTLVQHPARQAFPSGPRSPRGLPTRTTWELSTEHSIIMRPSSIGGGRILRRTLSVCLSVRPVIVYFILQ